MLTKQVVHPAQDLGNRWTAVLTKVTCMHACRAQLVTNSVCHVHASTHCTHAHQQLHVLHDNQFQLIIITMKASEGKHEPNMCAGFVEVCHLES